MGAHITAADLEVKNGVPRVEDLVLARALGFTKPLNIRPLIRRHMSSLTVFGEVFFMCGKPTAVGGRPGKTFFLNEDQAIYITAKSDTPRAAELTVEMVRVFRAYLQDSRAEKPVKVRAHRRALPVPVGVQPGQDVDLFNADVLGCLFKIAVAANVRVERGFAHDFGAALEGVLLDMASEAYGGGPSLNRALLGGSRVVRQRIKYGTPLPS